MNRDDPITFEGVTQSIADWALDYGITADTIVRRLAGGMSVEKAITKPIPAKPGDKLPEEQPKRMPVKLTHAGRSMTVHEWSDEIGISTATIYHRLNRGWTVEQTLTRPLRKLRGVVANSNEPSGTGGGRRAQEAAKIEFSNTGAGT